jgi:hypothetical protein
MFRTLGLHHLCVINRLHQIVGIVTREDLVVTHRVHSETSHRRSQQFDDGDVSQSGNNEQQTPHFSPEHHDHLRNRSKKSSSVLSPLYPPLSPPTSPFSPLMNEFLDHSPDGEDNPAVEGNGELRTVEPNGHHGSENGNSFGRNRRQSLNHTIDLRASV